MYQFFLDKLCIHEQIVPTVLKKELLISLPFLGKCYYEFENVFAQIGQQGITIMQY